MPGYFRARNSSQQPKQLHVKTTAATAAIATVTAEEILIALEEAQKGLRVEGAQMQSADVLMDDDVRGTNHWLIVLGSRGSNQVLKIYRVKYLPLLNRESPSGKIYMEEAHKEGQKEATSTLHRLRQEV